MKKLSYKAKLKLSQMALAKMTVEAEEQEERADAAESLSAAGVRTLEAVAAILVQRRRDCENEISRIDALTEITGGIPSRTSPGYTVKK